MFGEGTVVIRASAETTGGAFTVFEEVPPLTSPAGFEGFFRELAKAEEAGTLGPVAYAAASEEYGITWLG